jgi:hypothetical protein
MMSWLKSQKYTPPKVASAKKIEELKASKHMEVEKLIREWKAVDPVEEWHSALADLVESYDFMQLIGDQTNRDNFEEALENARELLVDD